MYQPLGQYYPETTGLGGLLTDLYHQRRSHFTFLDHDRTSDGKLQAKSTIKFTILNTLASCLGIPLLFFISFNIINIYATVNVLVGDLLSVMFVGAALSVFLDTWVGYFYDRMTKLGHLLIKKIIVVIATIGLVISSCYLFQPADNAADATTQFRATIIVIAITYTFSNVSTFKNGANLTPSNDSRGRYFYVEYAVKAFFIFLFISIPFWVKSTQTDDCNCGDICSASPGDKACLNCLNICDTFTTPDIFQNVVIGFTIVFGLANIATEFLITPRSDETYEPLATSFNRRIAEVTRNGLLFKTFLASVLQYTLFFGFVFWINFYIDTRSYPTEDCTRHWGTASYLCTKSWLKQLAVILILVISLILTVVVLKKRLFKFAARDLILALIVSGILLCFIGFNDTTIFIVAVVFWAIFYSALAGTKLAFSNGMFYDEYLSGAHQPYFTSSIYMLAVKFGFFIALAFHFTFIDEEGTVAERTNVDAHAFGGLTILLTILAFLLGYSIHHYDVRNFDKIHIAIQKNRGGVVEELSFYDPIERAAIVKPVTSEVREEQRFIRLMYHLDPRDDLKLAVNGKHSQLRSNAKIRTFLFIALFVIFSILAIVFGSYLDTNYGWFIFIALLVMAIAPYGILYNYNVIRATDALTESKYKGYEVGILARFAALLPENQIRAKNP